jgi:hypothetical protein
MISKVFLFSQNYNIINEFLTKFYAKNIGLENCLSWQKEFNNPIDISELIAAFVDNFDSTSINMWISLDENVYIKITSSNADNIIKYLFERYPY